MFDNYKFRVGIVGNGKMGTDLFYYLNDFDFQLVWLVRDEVKKNGLHDKYVKKLDRAVKNGLIDHDFYNDKKNNTIISSDPESLKNCHLILETINEDIKMKRELFQGLFETVNDNCIFASNSSSFVPSKICPDRERAGKLFGLHFFYPVKFKNIAELIKPGGYDPAGLETIRGFLGKINKFYFVQDEKNPFLLNRMFLPFEAEAVGILDEGRLTALQIDALIEKHFFPIGIFRMFDSIGIDILYTSIKEYSGYYPDKNCFDPVLFRLGSMIVRNELGLKTGKGFYDYSGRMRAEELPEDDYVCGAVERLRDVYINAAYKFLESNAMTGDEMEYAVKEYVGIKKGPLELSREIGLSKIYQRLDLHYGKTGNEFYRPSDLLKN